jgi:sialic acid synthase
MKNSPTLIAEIGATHTGSMDRAKELIKLAVLSGADVVKFQKRNPIESVPKEWWDKPHPNQRFSYGDTYLDHRINLELSIEQHADLKKFCEQFGVEYSTSVWDMTSAIEVCILNPKIIKIPSAKNEDYEIIDYLYNNFDGDVHIALGMTSTENRDKLINNTISKNRLSRTVLYHCTSMYPCPFENLDLLEIENLQKVVGGRVGFSNHGYGIAADIAAFMLGAHWIERHFIDDRTFPHTDAIASLEPQGLQKLSRDLEHITEALKYRPNNLYTEEQKEKDKLSN